MPAFMLRVWASNDRANALRGHIRSACLKAYAQSEGVTDPLQSHGAQHENGRSQLQRAQQDVDEVCDIMLKNVNKASEREGKLGDLENRADQLLEQSKVFSKTANQVKQKKQWENMRMKVILAVIVGVVLLVVVTTVTAVILSSGEKDGSVGGSN
ncbi:vesicle-associated membrane protein 5 [Tachysurus ichikawai]